jgi:hypothetical protein
VRIAADVTAIGQDLQLELLGQDTLHAGEVALVSGDAEIGERQCRQRQQARIARRRVAPRRGQAPQLQIEAIGDGVEDFLIGGVEQHRGVAYPRDEPPPRNRRLGCRPARAEVAGSPFHHELAGEVTRIVPLHGVEVAQPAETVQRARPGRRRRAYIEGGLRMQRGDRTGEPDLAVAQLLPEARVGGAQVLRHDQELVAAAAERPAQNRNVENTRDQTPPGPVRGQPEDAQPLACCQLGQSVALWPRTEVSRQFRRTE